MTAPKTALSSAQKPMQSIYDNRVNKVERRCDRAQNKLRTGRCEAELDTEDKGEQKPRQFEEEVEERSIDFLEPVPAAKNAYGAKLGTDLFISSRAAFLDWLREKWGERRGVVLRSFSSWARTLRSRPPRTVPTGGRLPPS